MTISDSEKLVLLDEPAPGMCKIQGKNKYMEFRKTNKIF